MISSRREIVDSVLSITRQERSQIGSLVEDFINLTLNEINEPGWAYKFKNFTHLWSWLKRKSTFDTVASTTDYVLAREIDKVAILRQTETPIKLQQVPDDQFFRYIPNPVATGNPRYYRLWENEGVSTRLATADTVDVVSSSASDAGSADYTVTVMGYDSNGVLQTDTYQLNGTTKVSGTTTFAARAIFVSKRAATNGDITVTAGSTSLLVLGKNERAPKFKVISLYPQPSSAITMNIEFYTRIPELVNDSDVPAFDRKWHYVVRMGTLAKVYQYLNKDESWIAMQGMYADAVRGMVSADKTEPDLVRHLDPRRDKFGLSHQVRSNTSGGATGVIWW